jgi:hypothetical protein
MCLQHGLLLLCITQINARVPRTFMYSSFGVVTMRITLTMALIFLIYTLEIYKLCATNGRAKIFCSLGAMFLNQIRLKRSHIFPNWLYEKVCLTN